MASIGSAFESARAAVLNAVIGSRAGEAGEAEEGLGVAARTGLTLFVFLTTTIVWWAARAHGILGTASFYFPASLLVTLLAGWEFGLVILVAGSALVWHVAHAQFAGISLAVFATAGILQLLIAGFVRELLRSAWRTERTLQDISEARAREADSRELALGDARHRLKNLLAIIEALAKFSGPKRGENPEVDSYLKRFLGRLRALGAASDLALKHRRDSFEAKTLIASVLEPFRTEKPYRLHFDGPEFELSEQFGGSFALALHELATNALKYGALSVPTGSVSFRWTVTPGTDGEEVVFLWREDGGPVPTPPEKEGFGHRLIRAVAEREKAARVQLEYPPQGLVCRISYLRPG